jgi:hypothetical protein
MRLRDSKEGTEALVLATLSDSSGGGVPEDEEDILGKVGGREEPYVCFVFDEGSGCREKPIH